MLSFASAAYQPDRRFEHLHANLELLPGATGHPDTMAWWGENQAAFERRA